MSEALTITADGETFTRQPRRERPERTREEPAITIEGDHVVVSPEDALADSRQQLQAKDREVAEARRRTREAEHRAEAAQAEAGQVRQSQAQDRQAIVAQAIETATAEQKTARGALIAAQESGDANAMADAVEALSGASSRFNQATGELAWLKAQPAPKQTQPQQSGRTTEAQRWLDEHPRFNTDRKYRGVAIDAHNEALRSGNKEGSPEYVDFIDNVMAQEFGADHGHEPEQQQEEVRQPMSETRQRQGTTAVPPSRKGGNSGGWQTVRTPLGDLLVQERGNGTRGVKFPNPKVQSDFEEGAMLDKRASHSPEAKHKALAEYVNDQIEIAREIESGGSGDLVRGDGRTFGRDDA